MKPQKQTLKFQAEITQLLHLVTHSLYNNKEVFLRELISNSSDALDKLRFAALSQSNLYENDSELKIKIHVNKESSTLSIIDNGIGMTRAEAVENLGRIAKSGTQDFLSKLTTEQQGVNLIGQFGVGFYSAFMVAEKVVVKTRAAGTLPDQGVYWESSGTGEYVIQNIDKSQRGTEIVLYLKKEYQEYLEEIRLKNIITKYSDHIDWPIVMKKPLSIAKKDDSEELVVIEAEVEKEEVINKATALWRLAKSTITDEQYKELYKHLSHDFYEPLAWGHNHVEGIQEYVSLLYIPSKAPFDLWHQESQYGLKLYINRVFILEGTTQFLPHYLRFVRGIIDSSDLPLNVSREFLQINSLVTAIKKANVKNILALLAKMAEEEKEKYAKFWSEFGLTLKEGLLEDYGNREQLAELLRFATTRTETETQDVSLQTYLNRKLTDQEEIYYAYGKSLEAVKNLPHLEAFKDKGIEVIFLTDRIDEWLLSQLTEFKGLKLRSITNSDAILDWAQESGNKEEQGKSEADFSEFLAKMKAVLKGKVKDVNVSHRLTTFPACFVTGSLSNPYFQPQKNDEDGFRGGKPILEVNVKHPLIDKIREETDDARFEDLAYILYDQAILSEGKNLPNSAQYVKRVNSLLLDLIK